MRIHDVSQFQTEADLASGQGVFLILKGFNQLAIVEKIIKRKGNKSLGLTANDDVAKRKYSSGCIAYISLGSDRLTADDLHRKLECTEPFDAHINHDLLAYTNGYTARLLYPSNGLTREYKDDWMAYLHTVELSADNQRLLTASTGLDTILEIDLSSGDVIWEWNAWDHGFNFVKKTGRYLCRNTTQAQRLRAEHGEVEVEIIDDPRKLPKEGLPTHHTPINLNGVHYSRSGQILATGYHLSEVLVIDRSGRFEMIDLGLSHPHSFQELKNRQVPQYMVASSGAGRFLLLDQHFQPTCEVRFDHLSADEKKKAGFGEWLQTVNPIDEAQNIFAAVDALRSGIHIIDLQKRKRRFIVYPPEWTVQAVVKAPAPDSSILEKMFN